jgi:(p)ppGpp synthase/HD superfamily hydrolase
MIFAEHLHRRQTRKSTATPYISHPLAVASLVLEAGGSEDEAIAALLHDVIEDCGDQYPGGRPALRQSIRNRFGDAVLNIVNQCTDDDEFPKHAWKARKQAYLRRLEEAGAEVLRVACADKLHNARASLADCRRGGVSIWRRLGARSLEDQFWYYDSLLRIFHSRGAGWLVVELDAVVREWKAMSRRG